MEADAIICYNTVNWLNRNSTIKCSSPQELVIYRNNFDYFCT